jgi:hypothetical protein
VQQDCRTNSRYDLTANGGEQRFELTLAAGRNLNDTWKVVVATRTPTTRRICRKFNYQRNLFSAGVEAAW